ncbi:MAG: hypothetical protein WDN06_18340 [Asticcacaulis sp.]
MPPFVAPLVIISAACLAILVILYRIYETRVEQPKKLEDEVKEALGGIRADVESIEPVRHAAAAISYSANKIVIVREFGKKPTRLDCRTVRHGGLRRRQDLRPRGARRFQQAAGHRLLQGHRRYLAPGDGRHHAPDLRRSDPSGITNSTCGTPRDALTARAEGPPCRHGGRARKWFHHIEAILRRPVPETPKAVPPVNPVAPEPLKVPHRLRRRFLTAPPRRPGPKAMCSIRRSSPISDFSTVADCAAFRKPDKLC